MQINKKLIRNIFFLIPVLVILFAGQLFALGVNNLGGGSSGENINFINGNLTLNHTDVFLPGKGIPLRISRTYNSQGYNAFEMILLDYDHRLGELDEELKFKMKYNNYPDNLGDICQVIHVDQDAQNDLASYLGIGFAVANIADDIFFESWVGLGFLQIASTVLGIIEAVFDIITTIRNMGEDINNDIALFAPAQWTHCVNGVAGLVGFNGGADGEAMSLSKGKGGTIDAMDPNLEIQSAAYPMANLFLILEGGRVVNFKRIISGYTTEIVQIPSFDLWVGSVNFGNMTINITLSVKMLKLKYSGMKQQKDIF